MGSTDKDNVKTGLLRPQQVINIFMSPGRVPDSLILFSRSGVDGHPIIPLSPFDYLTRDALSCWDNVPNKESAASA